MKKKKKENVAAFVHLDLFYLVLDTIINLVSCRHICVSIKFIDAFLDL